MQLCVVPFVSGVQRQNLKAVALFTLNLGCLQIRGFLLTLTDSLAIVPNTPPLHKAVGRMEFPMICLLE